MQNYEDKRNEAILLIELCELRQINEPINVFHKKYLELFLLFKSKLELGLQGNELNTMYTFGQQYVTQCFIKNCKEPYRSQLSARHPNTLNEISNLITNDLQYVKNQIQSKSLPQSNQIQNLKPFQTTSYKHNQHLSPMFKYPKTQQSNFS